MTTSQFAKLFILVWSLLFAVTTAFTVVSPISASTRRSFVTSLNSQRKDDSGNLLTIEDVADEDDKKKQELKEGYGKGLTPIIELVKNADIKAVPMDKDRKVTTPTPVTAVKKVPLPSDTKAFEDYCLRLVSTEIGVKKLLGQKTTQPDLPLDVVFERTMDTIEDVVIHLRRLPYNLGLTPEEFDDTAKQERPTVVVLGTGWGAHAFIKVACTFDLRIVVVSPSNHFVFTPMLASAAVGTVEYRSMTEAIRSSNPTISDFIEGKAVGIDVKNKELTVELTALAPEGNVPVNPTLKLNYDYLVCSVGTRVNSGMVKGAVEHCFNLKSCEDARQLRTAVGEALEYASRPDCKGKDPESVKERRRRVTFVLVGGGPTGVELAGELMDFLSDTCRPRKGAYARLRDDVKVMLVHGGPDLVPQFEPDLRSHALKALEKRGVEVRLNTYTTEVTDKYVTLKQKGSNIEEKIPVGLTVWAAGNEPVPFIKTLLEQLPAEAAGSMGRIKVDKWMRAPTPTAESFGSILVLGDAACFETDPDDPLSSLPQTAQVAGQQGAFCARLLNREYDLTQTPPIQIKKENFSKLQTWLYVRGLEAAPGFCFLNLGLLAYVGGGEALTQVQLGDVPVFSYAGSVAFVLWRSVYLVKQVATRNRVLVTFDWIKSALFGRDVTRL